LVGGIGAGRVYNGVSEAIITRQLTNGRLQDARDVAVGAHAGVVQTVGVGLGRYRREKLGVLADRDLVGSEPVGRRDGAVDAAGGLVGGVGRAADRHKLHVDRQHRPLLERFEAEAMTATGGRGGEEAAQLLAAAAAAGTCGRAARRPASK